MVLVSETVLAPHRGPCYLTPGYLRPVRASLLRLGCDKVIENDFIGNGDSLKGMELGSASCREKS